MFWVGLGFGAGGVVDGRWGVMVSGLGSSGASLFSLGVIGGACALACLGHRSLA